MSSLGSCIICYGNFSIAKVSALPCGHIFHFECVMRWLQSQKNCPSCRAKCSEKGVVKQLFFNLDLSTQQSAEVETEKELERLRGEVRVATMRAETVEKEKEQLQRETHEQKRELGRLSAKVKDSRESGRKIAALTNMLQDKQHLENDNKRLNAIVKASTFYTHITEGGTMDCEMDKYITGDNVNVPQFNNIIQQLYKDALRREQEERKRKRDAEEKVDKLKRLLRRIAKDKTNGQEAYAEIMDELDEHVAGDEVDERMGEFSESFVRSALRPPPKGRLALKKCSSSAGSFRQIDEALLLADFSRAELPSTSRRSEENVAVPRHVSERVVHKERPSNGMGGGLSMAKPFDRLAVMKMVPSANSSKENRHKPYVDPKTSIFTSSSSLNKKKKKLASSNPRLSSFFNKQDKPSTSSNDVVLVDDDVIQLE